MPLNSLPPAVLPPACVQTPSADPELWQAIVASLDEQDKRQQRQISRHLSDVSPEVAGRLRQHRQDQLRCSPEGVTFFDSFGGKSGGTSDLPCASSGAGSRQTDGEGGGGGGGSSSRTEDTGSASRVGRGADSLGPSAGSDCGLVLPSFASYPPAVRDMVLSQLCNEYLQHEAESVSWRQLAVLMSSALMLPLLLLLLLGVLGGWSRPRLLLQLQGAVVALPALHSFPHTATAAFGAISSGQACENRAGGRVMRAGWEGGMGCACSCQ